MDLESFSAQLDDLRRRALAAVAEADDPAELDEVESAYLGRKGELRTLLGGIGKLPAMTGPRLEPWPTRSAKSWSARLRSDVRG